MSVLFTTASSELTIPNAAAHASATNLSVEDTPVVTSAWYVVTPMRRRAALAIVAVGPAAVTWDWRNV
jgi:hypothetical protein